MAEYLGRGLFSKPQEVAVPDLTRVERRPVENISEGRLRAGERRGREEARTETEVRLRSDQPSQASINIPSAARMRLEEQTRQSSSLSAHISSPVTRNSFRQSVSPQVGRTSLKVSPSPLVPRREDNPFGSPDCSESLGEDNPFAESSGTEVRP